MSEPLPIKGMGYKLLKDWDFGRGIQTQDELRAQFYTRYIYANGTLDFLNDEWQRYRDNNNHVLNLDHLSLVARAPTVIAPGKIESGMLRSKFTFKYGYIEGRFRLPRDRGAWPAFWLNCEDQIWPPELDIFEVVVNHVDTSRDSFHNQHGKAAIADMTVQGNWRYTLPFAGDHADGFHTFAMLWEPALVIWYVDGREVKRAINYRWLHNNGVEASPAHLLVNMGIGGSWPGPPGADTRFPVAMDIDYIRVYQKDAAAPESARFTVTRVGELANSTANWSADNNATGTVDLPLGAKSGTFEVLASAGTLVTATITSAPGFIATPSATTTAT